MEIKNGYFNPDRKSGIILYEHSVEAEYHLWHDSLSHYLKCLSGLFGKVDDFNLGVKIKGVEIGVLNGNTSSFLLNECPVAKLIGIDPIIPDSMENSLIGSEAEIIKNTQQFGERFEFIKDYSQNVVDRFEDNSYDFIFIDGDHNYEAVKRDFELYFPKIVQDGYIYFHDSRMNRGGAPFHTGSSQFVDELIANPDSGLELIGEAFSLTLFRKK